jgi:hypothetical protein
MYIDQLVDTFGRDFIAEERAHLSEQDLDTILERGRQWQFGATLSSGGSIVFPHTELKDCGWQIAAAVQACLDSGADRVLAIGVLHAQTEELQAARVRVANGADVTQEKFWGIQGPGLDGRDEWKNEFSLLPFMLLWEEEVKRRGLKPPQLIVRYPYLAGGRPERLPGIEEVQSIARDAIVVSTADPFHHGLGYDTPADQALYPDRGGLDLARRRIEEGLEIFKRGDYWAYNQHCVEAKSDARDAGQLVRYLLGPLEGHLLDLSWSDMTELYHSPPPTWVAAALIELKKINP